MFTTAFCYEWTTFYPEACTQIVCVFLTGLLLDTTHKTNGLLSRVPISRKPISRGPVTRDVFESCSNQHHNTGWCTLAVGKFYSWLNEQPAFVQYLFLLQVFVAFSFHVLHLPFLNKISSTKATQLRIKKLDFLQQIIVALKNLKNLIDNSWPCKS